MVGLGWGVSILCLRLLCFGSSDGLIYGLFISCLIGYGSCRHFFVFALRLPALIALVCRLVGFLLLCCLFCFAVNLVGGWVIG